MPARRVHRTPPQQTGEALRHTRAASALARRALNDPENACAVFSDPTLGATNTRSTDWHASCAVVRRMRRRRTDAVQRAVAAHCMGTRKPIRGTCARQHRAERVLRQCTHKQCSPHACTGLPHKQTRGAHCAHRDHPLTSRPAEHAPTAGPIGQPRSAHSECCAYRWRGG